MGPKKTDALAVGRGSGRPKGITRPKTADVPKKIDALAVLAAAAVAEKEAEAFQKTRKGSCPSTDWNRRRKSQRSVDLQLASTPLNIGIPAVLLIGLSMGSGVTFVVLHFPLPHIDSTTGRGVVCGAF